MLNIDSAPNLSTRIMHKKIIFINLVFSSLSYSQILLYSDPVEDNGAWTGWSNLNGDQFFPSIVGLSPTAGNDILHYNETDSLSINPSAANGTTSHAFNLSSGGDLTFSLDIGDFNNAPFGTPSSISILQGTSTLGTLIGTTPSSGNWETWSFSTSIDITAGSNFSIIIDAPPTGIEENTAFDNFRVTVIPEPSSVALLALGTGGLLARRRR